MGETAEFNSQGIVLRPHGCARYAVVPFLLVWLCGWAVAEAALLNAVFPGLDIPTLPGAWSAPRAVLLLFFVFWTIGGITAVIALLRSFSGSDTLEYGAQEFTLTRRIAGIGISKTLRRDDLKAIDTRTRDGALIAWTRKGTEITLSTFGTGAERKEAAERLRQRMALPALSGSLIDLTSDWLITRTDAGLRIESAARPVRSCGGCLALGAVMSGAAAWAVYGSAVRDAAVPLAVFSLFGFLGAIAVLSSRTRIESRGKRIWYLENAGPWKRVREIQAQRLVAVRTVDSDGDERITLVARGGVNEEITLASTVNEPWKMIALGEKLAQAMTVPLEIPAELRRRA